MLTIPDCFLPFSTCAGEFLWIPAKLGTGLGGRDKNVVFHGFMLNKLGTLRNVNLRTVIIWGTIMHVCLYNIFKSSFNTQAESVSLTETDLTLLKFTGACMTIVATFTIVLNICLKMRIKSLKKRVSNGDDDRTEANGDGDDSDFSDDDDASYEE